MSPAISIIVPTYNRWLQLQRTLDGLAAQTVPSRDLEIIVVSDGSTDGTDEHLQAGRSPIDIVFHRQENSGPAVARNKGMSSHCPPALPPTSGPTNPVGTGKS
jgi:glycosyltransferase involved in cell wall biosynthesis